MKERPILFSGPMVRALLDGRKTQTRRKLPVQPEDFGGFGPPRWWIPDYLGGPSRPASEDEYRQVALKRCPYGAPGDRLWVRELGWQPCEPTERDLREGADTWPKYAYDADGIGEQEAEDFKAWGWKRRPAIHMPRWASRIALEVTGIRVERLQEISYEDALAEGAMNSAAFCEAIEPGKVCSTTGENAEDTARRLEWPQRDYRRIWESINGAGSWDANPWVWVVEFKTFHGTGVVKP